ncbi:phage protein NinX family protein [Providencia stuartii]|uniref:phage protein NinX family protein n=1 Tax=Providencia stuartii TaxID=588 RepID=UPI00111E6DF8|nr:phage protein NinX family protein [Providencia stuartii]
MNKYTELSDFEINRRIAEMDTKNRYVYFEKEQTIFRKFNNGQTQKFNPCNYPNDIVPIIIDKKISVYFVSDNIGWAARDSNTDYGELECTDKNYCRAAAILFLLMKDI